jgi:pyruvate dehydrogenase E2 component (dihydrolipoamide acetyltransferase)
MPEVLMPRLSDTMEEGTLSQWVKQEGDQVRKGDILAVIETDKAAMDMEAYDEGVLTRILVPEGASVPVGSPIAIVGSETAAAPGVAQAPPAQARAAAPPAQAPTVAQVPGSQAPAAAQPAAAQPPRADEPPATPPPLTAQVAPPGPAPLPPAAAPAEQPQVRTSPLARNLARRHGVDLSAITGSGPGGRIVRADVEDAARKLTEAHPAPTVRPAPTPVAAGPAVRAADAEEVPLSTVRRITAERLAQSAREAPHFYLTIVADADQLVAFRAQANERGPGDVRISVTDTLVKACAAALAAHPEVNCSWAGDRILQHRHINIGIAVAIDGGLIVPVIRDADRKTLTEIAREAHALTAKARTRRLSPDEFTGGTFTISNLGMYGIQQFTAVINPPEAAILAVGAATRQPVARGDQLTVATTMTLTLSIDHRALDGAMGAVFLADLKKLIEEPLRIVL